MVRFRSVVHAVLFSIRLRCAGYWARYERARATGGVFATDEFVIDFGQPNLLELGRYRDPEYTTSEESASASPPTSSDEEAQVEGFEPILINGYYGTRSSSPPSPDYSPENSDSDS